MFKKVVLLTSLLCFLAVVPACGKKVLKTEGVTGVVTFNGAPLANATVHFVPADATGSASYGKTNEKGEYKLQTLLGAADAGTTPGKYKVKIECVENYETGETFEENGEEKREMKVQSVIPAQYTDENTSGFEADVVAGANTYNFDLVE